MKIKFLLTNIFTTLLFFAANAQNNGCTTTAVLLEDTINCGDSAVITLSGYADFALNNDFNGGTAGSDWQATSSAQFDNPYIPNPNNPGGANPNTYLWMGPNSAVPRELVSDPLDLTFGGQICFDLVYAVQSGASPTEGPDQAEEGVSLQYSIDGGVTWVDIAYFMPNGVSVDPSGNGWGPGIWQSNPGVGSTEPGANGQTQFTQWATYCFPIPAGAQGLNTQIQWSQIFDSNAGYDHWGLDNIQIFVADPSYGFFDDNGNFQTSNTVIEYPTTDSTYTFLYTNGIDDTCYASATVYVNPTDAGPDLIACETVGRQLNVSGVAPWSTVSWTPGASLNDSTITNPFATPSTDTEYIVTSDCGVDSVTVFVEDLFTIATTVTQDTICVNGASTINLSTVPTNVTIASIDWNNYQSLNDSTGNQVIASPISSTNYIATVTSDSGCVIQDSVVIYVQGVAAILNVFPSDTTVCKGDSLNLEAIASGEPYTVSPIAFSPYPTTGGTVIGGFTDDNTQGPLPISFNFPFFGNTYNNIYFSSNGWLSFNLPNGSYLGNVSIPNTAQPNNIIAWAWDDLNFNTSGTFSYYEGGTAPNRYLVLNFLNVSHFGGGGTVDVQIVLHENGLIEFYNIDIQSDGGGMTQGIENSTGTIGYPIPGHDDTPFNSQSESWAYIPYTPPVNAVYTWQQNITLNTTSGPSVIASPSETTTYYVEMQDGFCTSFASATVDVDTLSIDSITDDIGLTCAESNIQLYVNASTTVKTLPQDSIHQIGFGTLSTTSPTPYNGLWEDGRYQVIYTAAELAAAGINPGSNINGMAFNVISKFSSAPYNNFTISAKHTTANSLTAFDAGGFSTLFNPNSVTTFVGWNWYNFNTPFTWNGTSNILFQICFDNTAWTNDDAVAYTATTTTTVAEDFTDGANGCTLNSPNSYTERANVRFRTDYILGSIAPISYQWSSNPVYTFDDDTIFNPIIEDTVGQNSTIYVEATDGFCTTFDTVLIDLGGGLTLTSDTSICQGDSVQLFVAGGTNPTWTPSNTLTSATTLNPIAFPTTTTIYEVSVDAINCTLSGTVEVTISEVNSPQINGGATQIETCEDEPVDLTSNADSNNTNIWTGPETGNGTDITVNTSGTYTLTTTNTDGCDASSSIVVNIANIIDLDTNLIRNVLCCNDAITIVFDSLVTNDIDITEVYWDGGTSPHVGPATVNSFEDGTYTIKVIDENGCEANTQVNIVTKCNNADIDQIDTLVLGQTHDYTVTTNLNYEEEQWLPSELFTNSIFSADSAGENLVYVNILNNFILNNGEDFSCVVSDSSSVYVISISNPTMPDGFTPNGDGLNDRFFPVSLDPNSTIESFVIYNRWGEMVYEYNNDKGWDGKWQGENQPIDTYTYYLNINKTTENYIHSGTITLIR